MLRTTTGICLALAIAVLLPAVRQAEGCMPFFSGDFKGFFEINEETAIIVWDAANKTQHFIRRSNYKTDAKDFGFLVPTPTQPTLSESRDLSFDFLGRVTDPPELRRPGPIGPLGPGPGGQVEVLEVKSVGKFIATVLKANDAAALNDWLKKYGYQSRPEQIPYLEPYVKAGWIITAFRIASTTPNSKAIDTSAVRMSFKTEKPFYPYREAPPAPIKASDKKVDPPQRTLRIYFLARERVEAKLGDGKQKWAGATHYAKPFSRDNCKTLAWLLQADDWRPTGNWWLTELVDPTSPRRGTDDLFFSASTDQSELDLRNPIDRVKGMKSAVADIDAGKLKLVFPPAPDSLELIEYKTLLKTLGVETAVVGIGDAPKQEGPEMNGYNDVMTAEIEHRFGKGTLERLSKAARDKEKK